MSATLPIIFLTARDSEFDTVSGLRLGADDYLTKDASLPKRAATLAKVAGTCPLGALVVSSRSMSVLLAARIAAPDGGRARDETWISGGQFGRKKGDRLRALAPVSAWAIFRSR